MKEVMKNLLLTHRTKENDYYYCMTNCFEEFVSVVKRGETKELVEKNTKRLEDWQELPKSLYDKIHK